VRSDGILAVGGRMGCGRDEGGRGRPPGGAGEFHRKTFSLRTSIHYAIECFPADARKHRLSLPNP